jgi:hypothetical protein
VWVPAFAGTTSIEDLDVVVTFEEPKSCKA